MCKSARKIRLSVYRIWKRPLRLQFPVKENQKKLKDHEKKMVRIIPKKNEKCDDTDVDTGSSLPDVFSEVWEWIHQN